MKPKTYCEKWPSGCMMCDLLLCDGEKNQPAIKMYGPGELEIEANNLLRKMVANEKFAINPSKTNDSEVKANNWIPMTERLPESGERVLVSNGKGFVCEAYLSERKRWMRHGCIVDYITPTHWMPLPEPPKEGE